jgi:hypothetical protein
MAQDTRDIAIGAATDARNAHRRLNTVNGQIDGLRGDVAGVSREIGELKARVTVYAALAAAIGAGVASVVASHWLAPSHVAPRPAITQQAR